MLRDAAISPCGTYRYMLSREWLTGEGAVLFIMLNPSTADTSFDDPTTRRCIGFAQRWGYRRLLVANIFAFRSTDPRDLPVDVRAIGPDNNYWIQRLAGEADLCIAAWGASDYAGSRAPVVLGLLADLTAVHALKRARGGAPRHPLYVRGDAVPFVLRPLQSMALPVDAMDCLPRS